MKNKITCSFLIACALAVLSVGCKEKTETEKAVDATKSATQDAGDAIKNAAAKTGDVVKDAAAKTGDAVKDAANEALDATKEGAKKVGETATNILGNIKEKLN